MTGADLTSLKLSASDGFVLSQIDGRTSLEDIADATGIPIEGVTALVEQLVADGVVEWKTLNRPKRRATLREHAAAPDSAPKTIKAPPPRRPLISELPEQLTSDPPAAPEPEEPVDPDQLYNPAELDEEVDIERDTRELILEAFYRAPDQDHYEALGVERDAAKKEVRTAYFKLSKLFHTDRFFGKELGSFRNKMEVVFKRLTEAYETLSRKKTRAKYDQYLTLIDQTRAAQHATKPPRPRVLTKKKAPRDRVITEEFQTAPTRTQSRTMRASKTQKVPSSIAPPEDLSAHGGDAPKSRERKASDQSIEARRRRARELMSRRLGARQRIHEDTTPMPVAGRDERLRGLTRSLKEIATVTGGIDRVSRQIIEARASRASGDLVRAANSLRLALSLDQHRPGLSEEYDEVRIMLATSLADTYAKQATYEERQRMWAQAALSWAKVTDGRPDDAMAHERAADAIVKAGGDLRRARDMAQHAVELAPERVNARLILGRVYIALGMALNARRELQAAAKLDPANEMVKNLLRELK